MKRILITGAAGAIGQTLRADLKGIAPIIRLSDVTSLGESAEGEELAPADLLNPREVEDICQNVDAIVHLGATPVEAPWEPVLNNNIIGTYNLFEAARRTGVARIVFASSNHAIGYYRREQHIGTSEPVRPDSRYGASKAFGEALGRLYADKHGISVICLRIGSFRPEPENVRMLSTWISPRDMSQLTRCSLLAKDIHFGIFYGVSANPDSWWRDDAARIGYRPEDSAEAYRDRILANETPDAEPDAERLFHGGPFCGMEFSGDLSKIE